MEALHSIIGAMESFVSLYGIPGLFFVMVIQSLVPLFFPSDAVIVGAILLGMEPITTVIVSGLGSTVGAIIAFTKARKGGKPLVQKFVSEKWITRLESWFDKWGWSVVTFGRAAPFLSSDAIAYVAGITKMTLKVFIPLALIGAILRAIILVVIGTGVDTLIPLLG